VPWGIIVAAVCGLAIGLGIGIASGAGARARMARIREATQKFAAGNLGHRVMLPGHDDAARSAEDLNTLADAVQREREAAAARDTAQRQLLANISHDLRTPITSIAGYVDALQRGLGDDPERYLAVIAAKTGELAELTDDLFYEARLDAGDLELKRIRVDLAEAVRRAVLGFESQFASRGVRVETDIPEEGCPVEADASAVTRILGNLVSNALRHGEGMTTFSVTVAAEHGGCCVRLVNDGARMPADVERLFERGVAGAGGGAGLGLSIARDLAERMGATVDVELIGSDAVAFVLAFPASAVEFSES